MSGKFRIVRRRTPLGWRHLREPHNAKRYGERRSRNASTRTVMLDRSQRAQRATTRRQQSYAEFNAKDIKVFYWILVLAARSRRRHSRADGAVLVRQPPSSKAAAISPRGIIQSERSERQRELTPAVRRRRRVGAPRGIPSELIIIAFQCCFCYTVSWK